MSFFCLVCLILFLEGGIMFEVVNEDIPSPLSPSFVECVRSHGLIGLIDRNSKDYDSSALVNGRLNCCLKQ